MTQTYKKKLIEVALPLEAINAASIKEKSNPFLKGHPRALHQWWARRPLPTCRAVLFGQLVDDPSEHVDTLLADTTIRAAAEVELAKRVHAWRERQRDRSEDEVAVPKPTLPEVVADLERKRLFGIIEELVKWENSTNEEVLERARAEIRRSCGGELPPVYDPFSGGGAIPFEAQRLGLPAYGSDLNPVAVMIGKAMIEIPSKFRGMGPIHPGLPERNHYRNAEGLAEDIQHYGDWIQDRAREQIAHLYPQVDLPKEYGGGKATVIAWIWARTVPSPDPAFSGMHVPLASSFLVSSKKGQDVWIEPIIDRAAKTISYRIRRGGTKAEIEKAKAGTTAGKRQAFICPVSGTPITYDYIRSYGKSHGLGETLIAIVAEGARGRIYVEPNEHHVRTAMSAQPTWEPETALPDNPRDFKTPNYGLTTFGDLFTDRQLVALNTFSDLVQDVRAQIEQDALVAGMDPDQKPLRDGGRGAKAYAEAISVYLAFGVDKLADYANIICGWNNTNENIAHLFGRQAIPMSWDFVEGNPFGPMISYSSIMRSVSGGLSVSVASSGGAEYHVSAQDCNKLFTEIRPVISTDPPYYDNVSYADLSDFFYVWLRRNLRSIFPEIFNTIASPKREELIAAPYRHGSAGDAEMHFIDGMTLAFKEIIKVSSKSAPTAIYYAFKQSEVGDDGISSVGWATFLEAVMLAGFSINGTWPVRTERTTGLKGKMNALANSVILVCREKEPSADVVTRAEFVRALKRELPPAIAKLQAANIAPADMPQSAIEPGMGVFSRYAAVLESDDSPMSVKTALQLINAELDTFLSSLTGDFDAETRFAVTWFEQFGYDKGEFGTAQSLCQARGLAVDAVKHAGIIESAAGKVRLLKRSELDDGWDPNTDPHLTVWECLQYLVRALDGGEENAARVLRKIGTDRAGAVKDLAYYLYDLAGNKRRDAQEATAYNALIALWSDLTGLAATVSDDAERQASLF